MKYLKRKTLLNARRKLARLFSKPAISMLLAVLMIASSMASLTTAFAGGPEELIEGEAFIIPLDTQGLALTLELPDGLALVSGGNGFNEEGLLMVEGEVDLEFIAVAGDYTLTLMDEDGIEVESISFTVQPAPLEEGSVGGFLWLDANADGVYDSDESALGGYPVHLYLEGDTANAVDTVTTGADGQYIFENLEPGTYIVGINPNELGADQYLFPLIGIANDNMFKVADDWESVISNPISLAAGEAVPGIDAGMRNPMGVVPTTQTNGDNSLTVKVGDSATSSFVDVDDISNATNWVVTDKRQIQITANFGATGTTKDRTITVNIPRGYKITEYSAVDGTPTFSGVAQIAFGTDDEPKVTSSSLTAADGTSWAAQVISGYTGENIQSETNKRVYDGKVVYTFNDNCDQIILTLTLALDQSIMPHNATTTTLDDLTVDMQSGTVALSDYLSTTVTDLAVTAYGAFESRVVPGVVDSSDPDMGTVPEFMTSCGGGAYGAGGVQNHLAESAKIVQTYPDGVTFEGFKDGIIATSDRVNFSEFTPAGGDIYTYSTANNHLVVTLNTASRTVTFEYSNFVVKYTGGSVLLYWTAEVDNSSIRWDDVLNFSSTFDESSGEQTLGTTQPHTQSVANAPKITIKKPAVRLEITARNRTRSDLNAYANQSYPYDYMLGGFDIQNIGPSVAENLLYEFAFPHSLEIRGVALPGLAGNNYSGFEAIANTGRIITLTGPFIVTNTQRQYMGFTVDSVKLGLGTDEYLVSLKAWQDSLNVADHVQSYTYSNISYFGRFQNGTEGDVTLSLYDVTDPTNPVKYSEATDHATIGGTQFGAGIATLTAVPVNPGDGTGGGSFYPGAAINFTAIYTATEGVKHQNDAIDPIVYICLPEGIAIDSASVKAKSVSGNFAGAEFALQAQGSKSVTLAGKPWTVYAYSYTSANKLDMVAQASHGFSGALRPSGYNQITVTFTANVSSACGEYTGLTAKDIVVWDFGKTAVSATTALDYTFIDANDIAGKGASYGVVGATQSTGFNIVKKPGFNVRIGIRTYEGASNPNPFYTYNGTRASIAPVTVDAPAEIFLEYFNADSTDFLAGSEIYLPIPKEGKEYDAYFNYTEVNPAASGSPTSAEPEWTGALTGPVSLPGFTTHYTTDTVYTTNVGPQNNTWVPIDCTWTTSPGNYADVTMVKFVANASIAAGASGSTTFTVDVDAGARLGDVNFWRSYQKGWRGGSGNGSWVYGSVIAAEPSMSGVEGMFFLDLDVNGFKAATGEDFDPTLHTGITAVLTEKSGGIAPLTLTLDTDGGFKSLNSNGTQYYLKTGEYTITVNNNTDGAYGFTPTAGAMASNASAWYMDIPQANIAVNQGSATYGFVVDSAMSTDMTLYVGVGVRSSRTVTYKPGTGAAFTQSTESVPHGNSPIHNPSNAAANVTIGYDPDTMRWTIDKAVTLNGGMVIPLGTPITTAQLRQIKVVEDITATATFSLRDYVVTYTGLTGSSFDPTNPNVTSYKVTDTFPITITNPTKTGFVFEGWTVDYANTGLTDITAPTDNYKIPAATTGSITITANWTAIPEHDVTYSVTGEKPTTTAGLPSPLTQSVYEGATVTVAANPSTTETTKGSIPGTWAFSGWTTTDAIVAGGTFTMPTTDVTITGSWTFTPNTQYAVSYTVTGDEPTAVANMPTTPKDEYQGATVAVAANPTTTETTSGGVSGTWVFSGWTTSDASVSGGSFTMPGKIVAFSGSWTFTPTPTYTVQYLPGAHGTFTTQTTSGLAAGDATPAAPATTGESGWNFTGWSPTPSATVTANVDYVAQWTSSTPPPGPDPEDPPAVTYTVTFVDWDGSTISSSQVERGGSATAPADPTREGYTFTGWSGSYTNVTSNVTVTAQYRENPKAYTVTFVDWDGSEISASQVEHGGSATAPADPTREGYTFTGWNGSYTNVTANTTVTAQYTENPAFFTVTFVDWDSTVLGSSQVPRGGSATAPTSPTRDGYTFTGWDRDYSNVTSNITVTAQYSVITTQEPPTTNPPPTTEPPTTTPPTTNPPTTEPPTTNPPTTEPPTTNPPTTTPSTTTPSTTTPSQATEETPDDESLDQSDPMAGLTSEPIPDSREEFTQDEPTYEELFEIIEAEEIPLLALFGTPIPLFKGSIASEYVWALVNLILAIAGIILALITLIRVITQKRNEKDDEHDQPEGETAEEREKQKTRRWLWIIVTVIMGIAGLAVFFLTEDMTKLMVMVDYWTIVNAIIFILEAVSFAFAFKRNKSHDDTPDTPEQQPVTAG